MFCQVLQVKTKALMKVKIMTVKPLTRPEGIPTLTYWWGLCGHMIPRAMLAVAYATGRAFHARQVKGDDPEKKG
jgi:hypothetical protein